MPSILRKEEFHMYSSPKAHVRRTTVAGLRGVAVLLGAATLALPLSALATTAHHYRHHLSVAVTRETVEARITHMHAALMITPDEEQNWSAVARVMRANEASMQALVETEKARPAGSLTAVQDLRAYETFNQAHVAGLKDLIAAFEVLYSGMPAAQQAVADHVFQKFGHKA
jgi:hypothetical protein